VYFSKVFNIFQRSKLRWSKRLLCGWRSLSNPTKSVWCHCWLREKNKLNLSEKHRLLVPAEDGLFRLSRLCIEVTCQRCQSEVEMVPVVLCKYPLDIFGWHLNHLKFDRSNRHYRSKVVAAFAPGFAPGAKGKPPRAYDSFHGSTLQHTAFQHWLGLLWTMIQCETTFYPFNTELIISDFAIFLRFSSLLCSFSALVQ
jgi:hypothetical protein